MVGTKREFNEKVGLTTCRFSEIETPGTYVEHRLGTLLRVPGPPPGLPARTPRPRRRASSVVATAGSSRVSWGEHPFHRSEAR